jgi:hypothetical protein
MNKDDFKNLIVSVERIESKIYIIRGNKVLLDRDLAMLYGVSTKRLNEQFNRNINRFPEDFAFQLTEDEWESLRSQFATLNRSRSQFVTLNTGRGKHRKYLPYAFTEQGVAMLSGILRSPQAVKMNIEIMRAFVRLRHTLANLKDVTNELADLKSFMLKHSNATDREFRRVWTTIEKMAKPSNDKEQRKIGFDLD